MSTNDKPIRKGEKTRIQDSETIKVRGIYRSENGWLSFTYRYFSYSPRKESHQTHSMQEWAIQRSREEEAIRRAQGFEWEFRDYL